MKKNQSKTKGIIIGALSTVLILGAVGTITTGFLTNWTFQAEKDPFDEVKVESLETIYDGTAKTLDIKVPENASYEVIIKKGNQIVSECIEEGEYNFEVKVTIEDVTKTYRATLTIKSDGEAVNIKNSGGMKLRLLSSQTNDLGQIVQTFTYAITPEDATNQNINLELAWGADADSTTDDDTFKAGKTITDYLTVENDVANKEISVTNLKPFGSIAKLNITSVDNAEAKAVVTINYRKKRSYSVNASSHTIANNKLWSDYAKGSFSESIGTLASKDPTYTISLKTAAINSSLLSSLTGLDTLQTALKSGNGATVLSEVNKLQGATYNTVLSALNSHKEDAVTFNLSYATVSSYEFKAGYELGLNNKKVEGITVDNSSIEF